MLNSILRALLLLCCAAQSFAQASQTTNGVILFPPAAGTATGNTALEGNRAVLRTVGDALTWSYKPTRWGMYDLQISASGEAQLNLQVAATNFLLSLSATGAPPIRFYLPKSDAFQVSLSAKSVSKPIDLSSITLTPAPEGAPVVQHDAAIALHAHDAITHSVMMRFEPATNKNCLGYWVNPADTAEWKFTVTQPGAYEIELWQGCGKGQGGSDVSVEVIGPDSSLLKTSSFVVEDTGHFQIFIPRQLGRIEFPKPGEYSLWIKPQHKKAGAIMDVRQVLLKPAQNRARAEFPGRRSLWYGFERFDFEVYGHPVLVVAPKVEAPGRPWLWHGEFFGHKPNPDLALLGRGFHIVYMSVPDMLGAPEAVAHWNDFYNALTSQFGLSPKAALVGLSRGGLYCYNWAAANPEKTACIYADAPVCDFKSWPGGFGKGPGSKADWNLVLKCYSFKNADEAKAYSKNPVDNLAPLVRAHVPLLHVFGDADEVVPWEENTGLLADRYRQLGGNITLIRKPGVKHHPHGLDDSTPIVNFIWDNTASADARAWLNSHGGGPLDESNRPLLRKLGTIDLDLVETTPIVLSNRLWRFEWVRQGIGQQYWNNQRQTNYFRFRDPDSGEVSAPFADGHEFGSAFVHDGTVYVTGTLGRSRVDMFSSRDLQHWETWTVIDHGRYGIFNTSLCRANDEFVLMFEIDKPREEAGVPFTARFAKSKDLHQWTVTPPECNYTKDRYSAPHALRWSNGWFYDFYLEATNGYQMRVVRSPDLRMWESSPLNPVLQGSPFDKLVGNPSLTDAQRNRIATATNLNNSDIDFCEWQGRLTINYSWGNQLGVEHLAAATYDGSLEQFLNGWFPRDAK